MDSEFQDKVWKTVVTISSFPGFSLPVILYALLMHDISYVFLFLISLFVLYIFHSVIKYFFHSERPKGYKRDDILFPILRDSSFPSNHTAGVFLLYFFVYATLQPLSFLFLFFALLVALSRIQYNKHYPIDIIGGFMTAYIVFFFVSFVFKLL